MTTLALETARCRAALVLAALALSACSDSVPGTTGASDGSGDEPATRIEAGASTDGSAGGIPTVTLANSLVVQAAAPDSEVPVTEAVVEAVDERPLGAAMPVVPAPAPEPEPEPEKEKEKEKEKEPEAEERSEPEPVKAPDAGSEQDREPQGEGDAEAESEAEAQARAEVEARAEADRKAAEEAKAREEADRKADEEAKAKEEADRKAAEEAKAKEEADRKAAEAEAQRKADAESDQASAPDNDRRTIIVGRGPGDARCLALPATSRDFGSISKTNWARWVDGVRFANGPEFLSLPGERQGERTLRQKFVPTDRGTDRVVMGATLPKARTYRLVQSVLFEKGFDWGGVRYKGGKLGFGFSGGTAPSGGIIDPKGFTTRLIWRGDRYGDWANIAVYSYAADRTNRTGDDYLISEFRAPIGTWFDLAMEVKANSATNRSDGGIRVWINDELMLDKQGIGWQTAGGTPMIDNMYYSTFYGGSGPQWSPDNTTYLQFRDVCWSAVSNGYSGIDPDNGRLRAPPADQLGGGLLDDFDDMFPAPVEPRGLLRDGLEGVAFELAESLEEIDQPGNDELERAREQVNAARDTGYWRSESLIDPAAPTLFGLDGAHLTMIEAVEVRTGQAEPTTAEARLLGEVRRLGAALLDDLIAQAETAWRDGGCESRVEPDCASSRSLIDEAAALRDTAASLDDADRSWASTAGSSWTSAARAVQRLDR